MFDAVAYARDFKRDGFSIANDVLSPLDVERLRQVVAAIPDGEEVRRKRNVYGVRNLIEVCDEVRTLAAQPQIRKFVIPVLGEGAFAVRAIFFDKVPGANWALGWHQDSVISVKERHDVEGFVAWAKKAGVWQVQPPAEVLAKMVAVRIHLDDCHPGNGPLRVIPGSHQHGWLDDEMDEWKTRGPIIACSVDCGGVVTMCPLTLHASSASENAYHRRVIHLEYACDDLPEDLDWNNRIGG